MSTKPRFRSATEAINAADAPPTQPAAAVTGEGKLSKARARIASGPPVDAWRKAIPPDAKVAYTVRMSRLLHENLVWLVDNTPRTSIQKIITEALEREVARRNREFRE